MKKILYILISLALIAAVVIRLRSNKATTQERVYRFDKQQPVAIQADTLRQTDVDGEHVYTGMFDPDKESRISAEVQGKVNKIFVDAGSVVKSGQPLLQLDNALLKLQLQSVEVQVEGLQSDVDRYTVLSEADAVQGVQLEKAQLGLKAALVQRSTLLEQIDKTTVRAPFSGIVTAKLTEVGAFAAPGIPLLQVTDIATLKFTVNVPEDELKNFASGTSVVIFADAYPDLRVSGQIVMIGSKGNAGNSFPVQVNVRNTTDLKIKSGMFGKLMQKETGPEKGIVIPASAITGSAVQPQVYVIRNGQATLRNITISGRIGNEAVVSSGLQEGEVIASGGFINLYDGANVIVKN